MGKTENLAFIWTNCTSNQLTAKHEERAYFLMFLGCAFRPDGEAAWLGTVSRRRTV